MLIEAQPGQGGSGERMTWTTAEGHNGASLGAVEGDRTVRKASLPKESRDKGLAA